MVKSLGGGMVKVEGKDVMVDEKKVERIVEKKVVRKEKK